MATTAARKDNLIVSGYLSLKLIKHICYYLNVVLVLSKMSKNALMNI